MDLQQDIVIKNRRRIVSCANSSHNSPIAEASCFAQTSVDQNLDTCRNAKDSARESRPCRYVHIIRHSDRLSPRLTHSCISGNLCMPFRTREVSNIGSTLLSRTGSGRLLLLGLGLLFVSRTVSHGDEDSRRKGPTPEIAVVRRQAEILHSAMHSALRVVHDRYYREDEGLMIPAAAVGEVFDEVERDQKIQLRWLAVEGLAMNVDHSARTDFERDAVKALTAGMPFIETVEKDVYRRAGPITLSNHCLKCHLPDRKSTRDRTAGLIISIPLGAEAEAEKPANPK